MDPVFIGGCSRSGTTLLGGMLGGHPDCIATPESPFKIHPLAAQVRRRGNRLVDGDIDLVLSDWFFSTWGLNVSRPQLIGERPPESLADLMQRLVAVYARRHGRAGYRHWIDHTPANIRYVGTLLEHFPTAKVIHLVRDGRAVAASVMRLDWGPNTAKDMARWWTSYISFGLAAEHALADDRILRVRYEDLVTGPSATLARISDFCGMDFHPGMLDGRGFAVPRYTARQHRLVRGPLRPERIDGWQQELTRRQIEIFEHYTGEALTYLGYELQSGLLARPPSTYEKWNMELSEIARRSLNKCLFAIRKRRFAA